MDTWQALHLLAGGLPVGVNEAGAVRSGLTGRRHEEPRGRDPRVCLGLRVPVLPLQGTVVENDPKEKLGCPPLSEGQASTLLLIWI